MSASRAQASTGNFQALADIDTDNMAIPIFFHDNNDAGVQAARLEHPGFDP
jgi:hypothetical protein